MSNKRSSALWIAQSAAIAALYVVLTLIFEVIGFALVGVDRLVAWLRGRSARR